MGTNSGAGTLTPHGYWHSPRTALFAAIVAETYGRNQNDAGESGAAIATWTEALTLPRQAGNPVLNNLALEHKLLINLGEKQRARLLWLQLQEAGYKDPGFLSKDEVTPQ